MTAARFQNAKITYFSFPRIGRGEGVNLFFAAAGIPFTESRIDLASSWPSYKKIVKTDFNIAAKVPFIELQDGKILSGVVPSLRFVSGLVNRRGKSPDEEYLVDLVADTYIDWQFNWGQATFGSDEAIKKQWNEVKIDYFFEVLNHYFAENAGEFLLGDDWSFADVLVFRVAYDTAYSVGQSLDDLLVANESKYGHFVRAVRAFQNLPAVEKYLETRLENATKADI